MIRNCFICNKEFDDYSNVCCSKECAYIKRKQSLKNYYKNTNNEILKEKYNKISKHHKLKITDEIKHNIENILKLTYVLDKSLIIKKTGSVHSYKLLNNYIEEFPENWKLLKSKMFPGFLPMKVQILSEREFNSLLRDIENKTYRFIKTKWNLDPKTTKRLFNFYLADNDKIDKKETNPEKVIRKLLTNLNIEFTREKYLLHQVYRYDFKIKNTKKIIEVNGNFWHSNPLIYGEELENLQKCQIIAKIKYEKKKQYYKENNFELLEIWESEIDENIEKVKNKIIKYAES